jgi:hypothetical protein
MALTNTLLLEARVAMEKVRRGEFNRPTQKDNTNYGIIREGIYNAPFLIPGYDINMEKKASSHTVKIPYMDRIANGAATVRGEAATLEGTSNLYTVPLQGYREEFAISDLEHYENDIEREAHLTFLLMSKFRNLKDRIEADLSTTLDSYKSQASNYADVQFAFDGVNFQHELALANQNDMYRHIRAMGSRNMIGDRLRQIGNPEMFFSTDFIANQGAANQNNTQYSVGGMDNFEWSNKIANIAGNRHTSYVYREGAFGLQFWTNQLHRNGRNNGYQQWTTLQDPEFGFNVECYIETGRADNSGTITGAQLDYVEKMVMFVETTFIAAPGAASGVSDIYKVAQLEV